jgi:eukaryotic-like serine/threonine-protein kinase
MFGIVGSIATRDKDCCVHFSEKDKQRMSNQEGRAGQQFGNYRLLRKLGQGGFGEVYLAEHLYLQIQVAIKVLTFQTDQGIRDLIRTEARTHARLDHPNIVRVLDFGFEEHTPYLVMTYAPGGTLRTLYPRGTRLSPCQIAFYVKQVGEALQYAHDQKVVHRDVKPENILLGPGNEILLSDFGIAVVAHQTHSLTSQEALGTTTYMAPEQAQGYARPASDQYALAVVIYEWLTGSPPFTGRSTAEVVLKHQSSPAPLLSQQKPLEGWHQVVFARLEPVLQYALAKDPHDRFPTIRAFTTSVELACREEVSYRRGTIFTSYRRHLDFVLSLAWEPSSRFVATGSNDATVQVWDATTGQRHVTYLGHTAIINSLAWSPDGRFIVSGSDDHTAQVWDAGTGKHLLTYQGHTDGIEVVAWSPDGSRIASAGDSTVQIWNATTGAHYLTYQGHLKGKKNRYMFFDLAWSPSGFLLASAHEDRTVQIWDTATGKLIRIFHGNVVSDNVVWTRENTAVLFPGANDASLWSVETGEKLVTYDAGQLVYSLAIAPNGKSIALGCEKGVVQIWDIATGVLQATYPLHTQGVRRLAWSPDGSLLGSANEREVYVWRVH